MKKLLQKRDQLRAALKAFKDKLQAGESLSAEEQAELDAKAEELQQVLAKIETQKASLAKLEELTQVVEEEDFTPVASTEAIQIAAANKLPNSVPADRGIQEPSTIEEFLYTAFYDKRNAEKKGLQYVDYSAEQRFDTGSKGGFMIPTRLLAGVREYARTALHVRGEAIVLPAGSPPDGEVTIPFLDQEAVDGVNRIEAGIEITWINEGGSKTVTDTNYRTLSLRPEEVAAIIPLTDKLIRNAASMVAYVSRRLGIAVAHAEEKKFYTGSGVGTPLGFINSGAELTVARATGGAISFADIKAMEPYVYDPMGTAKWYGNRAVKAQLLSLVGDGGGATNIIKVDQSTGQISIYGRPFRLTPYTAALGTKGDFCLCNFEEYVIKDGSGPIVETGYRSNDWQQNKTSVKITSNVDGKATNKAPFAEEDDLLISPFVVLDVPSGS